MGENTLAVLEEYANREIGRVTVNERRALELTEPERIASTIYVPVNPGFEVAEHRAVRLSEGLSMLVGTVAGSEAIVAKVLCFREPQFDAKEAEETALRWGFVTRELPALPSPTIPEEGEEEAAAAPIELHLHMPAGDEKRVLIRDRDGNIIGSEAAVDPEDD
jgi:hypothetical protein